MRFRKKVLKNPMISPHFRKEFVCKHSRGVYAIHLMLRCKVECMLHIGAMHAVGLRGIQHAIARNSRAFFTTQHVFHAHALQQHCVNSFATYMLQLVADT